MLLLTSPDGSRTMSRNALAAFPRDLPPSAPPPVADDSDFPLLTRQATSGGAGDEDVAAAAARSLRQPDTPLLAAFFSRANLEDLQRELVARVADKVGRDVGRQSDRELALVMRRVYVEAADPWPEDVADEVGRLNELALTGAVEIVSKNIIRYLAFYGGVGRPVAMPAPVDALKLPPFGSTPAPVQGAGDVNM